MTPSEHANEALAHAVEHLRADAGVHVALARDPLVDIHCPATSDVDLIVFAAEVDDLLPERLRIPSLLRPVTLIDVIRLPLSALHGPDETARMGLVPHRLLSSRVVHDKTGNAAAQLDRLRLKLYEPEIQAQRLTGFLDMGFYTVREVGVTWDFPALALFWLHVGHAACLAALVDVSRHFCPNVYTRPLRYGRELEERQGLKLIKPFVEALWLDIEPDSLIAPLRRLHATVARRFPEPQWPANMRHGTRYEYRYFASGAELEWRISVAEEMARRGNRPDAVFYLRFWAYSLARLPMVYHRAQEGIDVSFMRPECAVRADLEKHCPEILDDLTAILSPRRLTPADVKQSLDMLCKLREQTLTYLKSCDVELPGLRPWQPAGFAPTTLLGTPANLTSRARGNSIAQ